MTHEALAALATNMHAAIFLGALAAYYKYGDRTEVVARSLQGTDLTLRELRRLIAAGLAQNLASDLGDDSTIAALVLEPGSEAYIERPSNPLASERFRDSVRRFVESDISCLVDCRGLVAFRDAWIRSARGLSWTLLLFAMYQAVTAATLGFLDRTGVILLPNPLILWAGAPTVALTAVILFFVVRMLVSHDRIMEIRVRYADLPA